MPDGRGPRWAKRGLIAAVLVLGPVAAGNAWVLSESRGKLAAAVEAAPARPCVIVLGNKVTPSGPSSELAHRLAVGRDLYQAGRVPKIVVSGRVRPGYDEPRGMADWLIAQGVPARDIVLDGGGHRTAATMAGAAALGIKSTLVASQPYHLPRAVYLAQRAGIDAVGVPARAGRRSVLGYVRIYVRELFARAEAAIEVGLRGVRA